MASVGAVGASQSLAISGVKAANDQVRALGEGLVQTLEAARQTQQASLQGGDTGNGAGQDSFAASQGRGTRLDITA